MLTLARSCALLHDKSGITVGVLKCQLVEIGLCCCQSAPASLQIVILVHCLKLEHVFVISAILFLTGVSAGHSSVRVQTCCVLLLYRLCPDGLPNADDASLNLPFSSQILNKKLIHWISRFTKVMGNYFNNIV